MGLAKVHCGATPPSVMVLLSKKLCKNIFVGQNLFHLIFHYNPFFSCLPL